LPRASRNKPTPKSARGKERGDRLRPRKPRRKDLLIIECNSTKLAADGMDLGTAFARLTNNDFAKALRPHKRIVLVRTSTEDKLMRDLAETFDEHGRFRSILIVGHSNQAGLELTDAPVLCGWRGVGDWLQPFEPEYVFLAACEAGKSAVVRELFVPMKKTLRHVYASPTTLHITQTPPLALLILMVLYNGKIDETHSGALRLGNYILTGGQLFRWKREETGPGEEITAASCDAIASFLDRGVWDLAELLLPAASRNPPANH
jgi:hypothetical protein